MGELDLSKLEEELNKFAAKFEEVSMTLIAKMSEIDDKLNRINFAVELVEKLRIQKAENKRIMMNVENGFKNLLRRLEKMAKDGFVIPEGGGEVKETGSLSALNMTIESTEEIEDDLADLGEPPSMEEIEKQLIEMGELPSKEEPNKGAVSQPQPPITQPNIATQLPSPKLSKPENVQYTQSASGIPKSNLQKIPNPKTPQEILQNLIINVEEANLESHVGMLILKAKDELSKLIPFHSTYFDMVMVGGKIKASQKPNSAKLVNEIKTKINEWMQKFG
ncbi:MAG: hypothetical protein ACTSRZ_04500 [Promethearchaeota archaeon]